MLKYKGVGSLQFHLAVFRHMQVAPRNIRILNAPYTIHQKGEELKEIKTIAF